MWNQFNPAGYQNPGFPTGYQQQTNQPQSKYVEVIPVDAVAEAEHCPMSQGSAALFFARDDSFIASKRVDFNGSVTFEVYDRRKPMPPVPAPEYITREEAETMIAAALAERRTVKKEAAE